jgi:hypothetical protein
MGRRTAHIPVVGVERSAQIPAAKIMTAVRKSDAAIRQIFDEPGADDRIPT